MPDDGDTPMSLCAFLAQAPLDDVVSWDYVGSEPDDAQYAGGYMPMR